MNLEDPERETGAVKSLLDIYNFNSQNSTRIPYQSSEFEKIVPKGMIIY
jgi:hypothetical protein